MGFAMLLHVLSAVIWVGGMFFAYMVLRPVAAGQLEPPQRLPLWAACFQGFFLWVWAAVILLPLTGYWVIFNVYQGMAGAPLYVHAMNGTGMVMIGLYLWLYFGPYRALRSAVAQQDWKTGGARLATIRRIVGSNLLLGLLTITLAVSGRFLVPA
ncbi:MAG: hypothetical protein CVV05_02000 [Gammaproteobacteria bacterium HGW-Gammaproteobacteria-1]|jgi:uncharacterized membrane protein|nr:MAG: hypothetical protein CVV05_02000 [Gammaproteobacteria bacterium HGW-Gammaproteobacteria-1]